MVVRLIERKESFKWEGFVAYCFKQASKHSGGFCMELHTLGQEVGTGFIVGFSREREDRARGAHDGFVSFDESADHLPSRWAPH